MAIAALLAEDGVPAYVTSSFRQGEARLGVGGLFDTRRQAESSHQLTCDLVLSRSACPCVRQGKETGAKVGDPLKKAREGVYKQLDGLLRQLGDTKAAPHACCIAELCLFAFSREQAAQGMSSSLVPLRTVLKLQLAPLLADRCGHAPNLMNTICPAWLTPKPLSAQWFHFVA